MRVVIALEFKDVVATARKSVRMPSLAEVRLLEKVVVAASGHQEVLAQQRARNPGDSGMQEHLLSEVVRGDKGVAIAGSEVVATAIEALVDDAFEDDQAGGDKVHDAVVV
jgi:hypothetical protein